MEPNHKLDRRKEARLPHSGAIEISLDDPTALTVHGELLEISERGFRAAHDAKALTAGLEIHYKGEGSSGRARVIWTHVLDGRCVSGFLIR